MASRYAVFRAGISWCGSRWNAPYGWVMQCPSGINPRTVRNFPIQSSGAEVLHVACILAERRGIEVVAPVHDAIMAEASIDQAEDVSPRSTVACAMPPLSCCAVYELPTDVQMIGPGYEEGCAKPSCTAFPFDINVLGKEGDEILAPH